MVLLVIPHGHNPLHIIGVVEGSSSVPVCVSLVGVFVVPEVCAHVEVYPQLRQSEGGHEPVCAQDQVGLGVTGWLACGED